MAKGKVVAPKLDGHPVTFHFQLQTKWAAWRRQRQKAHVAVRAAGLCSQGEGRQGCVSKVRSQVKRRVIVAADLHSAGGKLRRSQTGRQVILHQAKCLHRTCFTSPSVQPLPVGRTGTDTGDDLVTFQEQFFRQAFLLEKIVPGLTSRAEKRHGQKIARGRGGQ